MPDIDVLAKVAFEAACRAVGPQGTITTWCGATQDGQWYPVTEPDAVWGHLPEEQRNVWRSAVEAALRKAGLADALSALVVEVKRRLCMHCFCPCGCCTLHGLLEDAKAALARAGKEASN